MSQAEYSYQPAGADLGNRVEAVWHLRHDGDDSPQWIAPDGACEIILHRLEPPLEWVGETWTRQAPAFLYGPLDRALRLQQSGAMDVIGIRLRPWAVGALGVRPTQWRNRAVPLDAVMGAAPATRLHAAARKAVSAADFLERAGGLLDLVLPWQSALAAARPLVEALRSGEVRSTAGLARQFGVTERTISRRFERACGLTARDMVRIVRFHRAREAIKAGAGLADVALDAGFADQAHMTREFRHFAGITPVPARQPAAFDAFYAPDTSEK